jgi:hypothetical protein
MLLKNADDLRFCSFFVFTGSTLFSFRPAAVSTAADLKRPAQRLYGILLCMRMDKAVQLLQVCRLKMPKAFSKCLFLFPTSGCV